MIKQFEGLFAQLGLKREAGSRMQDRLWWRTCGRKA
jgi:hypothetical protein